jgi:hypothetical protein
MEKVSSFEPLRPPVSKHTVKPIEKKNYLDDLYSQSWIDNFFNVMSKK